MPAVIAAMNSDSATTGNTQTGSGCCQKTGLMAMAPGSGQFATQVRQPVHSGEEIERRVCTSRREGQAWVQRRQPVQAAGSRRILKGLAMLARPSRAP